MHHQNILTKLRPINFFFASPLQNLRSSIGILPSWQNLKHKQSTQRRIWRQFKLLIVLDIGCKLLIRFLDHSIKDQTENFLFPQVKVWQESLFKRVFSRFDSCLYQIENAKHVICYFEEMRDEDQQVDKNLISGTFYLIVFKENVYSKDFECLFDYIFTHYLRKLVARAVEFTSEGNKWKTTCEPSLEIVKSRMLSLYNLLHTICDNRSQKIINDRSRQQNLIPYLWRLAFHIINYMKRNRRVGKETASANLFITQFKLKASQSTNKEPKHRKMNTTLANFKQILLQDDARKERQSTNGRQKPFLQQLKFKNKEEDFRPPQSITKRSISKVKEESRLKFGNQTNDFFDPIPQQPFGKKEAIDKSRAIAQYFGSKPQKPQTQKLALQEKLEKTALEKFNSVVLKENQQNQNLVSEKCAEVLYTLLKTARINKYRQGPILKSQPSEQNNQYYEQLINKNKKTQIQDNYLNHQNSNTNDPNSYFLKETKNKNQQLLLESYSKPTTHQHQQQSSFGLSKKSNQNHKNQVEEPRKSIYEKFDNQEDNYSQQSSFDDLNLKAQSSIAQKKDSISSKEISKGIKQQKKMHNLPSHQSTSKPNINQQRQQFKGAVGFNFVPKTTPINEMKNEEKHHAKKEQKYQRPTQGELKGSKNKLEIEMYNIKNKEKLQSNIDKFKIDDKETQTQIGPKNAQKDSKKPTKVQANIPQRRDEKDLYDIKNKTKIESIAEQEMISLKNKKKIQSIVDNFKGEDKNQIKKDINARKNQIKSDDKKSNLLSIPSQIESIPEAEVIQRKNEGQKANQQISSKNYISLNNNMIQKILTQDNLKKNSDNPKKQVYSNKISLPPPKLSKNTQVKNPGNSKIPINNEIDEDGIQQVNIGAKRQLFPQSSNSQKAQPKVIPSKLPLAPAQPKKQQHPQKEKIEQKVQVPSFQHSLQEEQPDELEDELCFYIEQIQDIGMYRIKSKDSYNDKSIDKQLIQIHRICAYYLAHQFLYLAHNACQLFKSQPFTREFYTISIEQLKILQQKGIIEEQVLTLQEHLQESKKLLKKSYQQCKNFLEKKEQILLMDPKISYHIKCCSYVIKQFKKVYQLLKKNPNLTTLTKRCVYLINLYCTLRLLNGQQLKQYEAEEEIENLSEYVEMNKHLLESQ